MLHNYFSCIRACASSNLALWWSFTLPFQNGKMSNYRNWNCFMTHVVLCQQRSYSWHSCTKKWYRSYLPTAQCFLHLPIHPSIHLTWHPWPSWPLTFAHPIPHVLSQPSSSWKRAAVSLNPVFCFDKQNIHQNWKINFMKIRSHLCHLFQWKKSKNPLIHLMDTTRTWH